MPSQILHTLFGEDVIQAASSALRVRFGPAAERLRGQLLRDYRGPFALGCQGPDIFYHSQMTVPVALEYGALLHRRAYGTFTAALLSLALPAPDRELDALGAYALAFMTHALLDRRCHPYIIYHSGWADGKGRGAFPPMASLGKAAHPFFERILDSLMIEYLRALPVSAWDQEALLSDPCGTPPEGLKELLAGALRAAFPERAGPDGKLERRIANALEDCAFFYRYTAPRRTSFRNRLNRLDRLNRPDWLDQALLRELPLAYCYPEALPLDIDYLNLARRTWPSPAGDG
ncbi:MAG: hypothetical protein LBU28_04625 [Spirochaetaceae bacterium]|jgi:hypothetical protein|nr:hypothetical protein [Spirochaetaceae bacterium]